MYKHDLLSFVSRTEARTSQIRTNGTRSNFQSNNFRAFGNLQKSQDQYKSKHSQKYDEKSKPSGLILHRCKNDTKTKYSPVLQASRNATVKSANSRLVVDWDERLRMLRRFKEEHSHCRVPQNHPELGPWVKWQREKYSLLQKGKSSSITTEEIESLNMLGFVWRIRNKREMGLGNNKKRVRKDNSDAHRSDFQTHDEVVSSAESKRLKTSSELFHSDGQLLQKYETTDESTPPVTRDLMHVNPAERRGTSTIASATSQNVGAKNVGNRSDPRCDFIKRQNNQVSHQGLDLSTPLRSKIGYQTEHVSRVSPITDQSVESDNSKAQMEHEMICKLCNGIIVDYSVCVPCSHAFCKSCVTTIHSRIKSNCPCCQSTVTGVVAMNQIDRMILNMIKRGYFEDNAASYYLLRKLHDKEVRGGERQT